MWPIIAAGAASALANIAGQVMANNQNKDLQEQANEANLKQSREQMAFQERMSSTAYQRQTADMKAAGINPIMAINQGGGASSPGGASAQSSAARMNPVTTDIAGPISQMSSTAMQVTQFEEQLKQQKAQTNAINAAAVTSAATAQRENATAREIESRIPNYASTRKNLEKDLSLKEKDLSLKDKDLLLKGKDIGLKGEDIKLRKLERKGREYELPVRKQESELEQKYAPFDRFTGAISNVLGSITSAFSLKNLIMGKTPEVKYHKQLAPGEVPLSKQDRKNLRR